MPDSLNFEIADLDARDVEALLTLHLAEAHQDKCSAALGKEALRADSVTLFSARNGKGDLVGIAGLKTLSAAYGEIKSVRTHPDFLRQGVSRKLMAHIEDKAKDLRMNALYLETHPTPAYAAACRLYENIGYKYCGPFGNYKASPNSVFMMKRL